MLVFIVRRLISLVVVLFARTAAAPVTFSLVIGAAIIWVVMAIATGLAAVVLEGSIWACC